MSGKIKAGDIELNYMEAGQGEEVLFINGLGTDVMIWSQQLSGLSKDHRVMLFDNRGSGCSDRPDGRYSMDILADDVENLLNALEVPSAHLVGHSMGGLIAQHMAIRHPRRVKSLVLAATFARSPRMGHLAFHLWADVLEHVGIEAYVDLVITQNFTHQYVEQNYRQIRLMKRLLADHLRSVPIDPGVMRKQIQGILAHDLERQLGSITVPTMVMVGAEDIVVPPHVARNLAEKIPGARFEMISGCGHNLMLARPEEFNSLIRSFTRTVSTVR